MTDIRNDLAVASYSVAENEHHSRELTGVVENNSTNLFQYVEVQFNAYDKDGFQVDSVVASVNNLEPNGKWKFITPVSPRASDVKLVRIVADDGDTESMAVYT